MYASETVSLQWKYRHATTGALQSADTTSVVVKDPTERIRVAYDSNKLVSSSTGIYVYYFDLPDEVIEGLWCVEITHTKGDYTTIIKARFHAEN